MTRRKIDPLVQCHAYIPRAHYACRLRLDQWQELKLRCARLNCSQGVYLEVLLDKVFSASDVMVFVSDKDVFNYSSQQDKLPVGDTPPVFKKRKI